jgi:hypothetical protein
MSPDEHRPRHAPAAERARLLDRVRRLVLMRETGPKSAAWHRARVSAIWRLQRELDSTQRRKDTKESANSRQ